MPRDVNGNYTLPSSVNPVIPGTVITALWANTSLSDIAQAVSDSLDRFGRGGMQAPLRMADGLASAPSLTFTNESTIGVFRPATGVIAFASGGVERFRIDGNGNVGIGTTSPQSRLHTVGTLTVSSGGEITTVDQALGIINFRSDDVSVSSSGTFASIAARNEFPGGWDGTLSRIDTYLAFSTASDATMAERMRLDSSGNLGLGVTPSAWQSSYKTIEVGNSLAMIGGSSAADIYFNAFINSGGSFRYRTNDSAAAYSLATGQHRWFTAPSGTAGAAITFTQAMTLDANGRLGLGTAPTAARLSVSGDLDALRLINDSALISFFNTANTTRSGYIQMTAASGTYIWNEATSPILFGTAGTERMRIDSAGNFIVGTGSPTSRANIFQSRTSGANALALSLHDSVTGAQTPGFGQLINWYSNGTATNAAIGFEAGGDGTNNQSQIAFYTQSVAGGLTRRATLTSAGLLQLAAGNTGGGVALNNAANASPTVLDWYEEGTFTPTLTGIGSPTYTTQSGSYTRIGNVVHFNITLNWTGGTNGASITVASLPFTAAGVNTPVNISVNYLGNASFTWTGAVKAYVSGGTTFISPVVESSGASNAVLSNPNAGTKDMIISGTYRVL